MGSIHKIFGLFSLTSLALAYAARAEPAEEPRGQIEVACVAVGLRPTKDDCAGRLSISRESLAWTETFQLSVNDPIESFSYAGRYRWSSGFFLRPPALGGLRDRFIDDDPFGSTLLFTTVVGGVGTDVKLGVFRLVAGVSAVYVKQRYAPTVVHSDELLDPEAERTFGFAQLGALGEGALTIDLSSRLHAELWGARLELRRDGRRLMDEEVAWRARFTAKRWKNGAAGLSAERYWRWQTLRMDRAQTRFQLSRAGVFIEF